MNQGIDLSVNRFDFSVHLVYFGRKTRLIIIGLYFGLLKSGQYMHMNITSAASGLNEAKLTESNGLI